MELVCCHPLRLLIFTILLVCQLNIANGNVNQQVHRRFEYKYSFKPPYLAQRDGSVPFFEYGGSKCIQYTISYISQSYTTRQIQMKYRVLRFTHCHYSHITLKRDKWMRCWIIMLNFE